MLPQLSFLEDGIWLKLQPVLYSADRARSDCSHLLPRHSLHDARASVWLMATAMLQDRAPSLPAVNSCPDHARVQTQSSLTAACPLPAVTSYPDNTSMMQGQSRQTGGANGSEGDPADPNKKYFFLNVKAYRKYFNVDTNVSLSCSAHVVSYLLICFL